MQKSSEHTFVSDLNIKSFRRRHEKNFSCHSYVEKRDRKEIYVNWSYWPTRQR
jgi:hypothetical protein